jgi:hypothetical protein
VLNSRALPQYWATSGSLGVSLHGSQVFEFAHIIRPVPGAVVGTAVAKGEPVSPVAGL